MNASQAKMEKRAKLARLHQAWTNSAIDRATDKITKHVEKGRCELDLKFPPRRPDDETSRAVAERFVAIMEAPPYDYTVNMTQRVQHIGVICEIIWA